jgi:Zn-dependent protease with chaperone function
MRDLATDSLDVLERRFKEVEGASRWILILEALAAAFFLIRIVTTGVRVETIEVWLLGIAALVILFRGFLPLVFMKRKRLDELRPDVHFGIHTRDSLVALAERVFRRSGLAKNAAPVYLIREKELNAQASRAEFLPGLRFRNEVYLNRSIVHLLDEAELESVVGHELGHVFPYAPMLSRFYLLHAFFTVTATLWLANILAPWGMFWIAPFAAAWGLAYLIGYPWRRMKVGIELLCDAHGARVAGLFGAMSTEVKMQAENEVRSELLALTLESRLKHGGNVPLQRLVETYQEALPFGRSDPLATRAELERQFEKQQRDKSGPSLAGFLAFIGFGGGLDEGVVDDASVEQSLRLLRALRELPVVEIDRAKYLNGSGHWSLESARDLVETIEGQPERLLFRVADELPGAESTHPNASRRVLFLWRNRERFTAPAPAS